MPTESPPPAASSHAADRWFREQGLPTFVPLRRWFTDLPRRVAPLVVWVTIIAFLLEATAGETVELASGFLDADEWGVLALVLGAFAAASAVAWAGYLLLRGLLRRIPRRHGTAVASAVIVLCLAALVVGGYASAPRAVVGPAVGAIATIAVCVLVTGMGGGALLSWASRLAVRNASAIGHMASIALPVILMLVVFSFFSAEVWQMATALQWGPLALVGLVVGSLATLVVLRVSASELADDTRRPSPEERASLLQATPAAHLAGRPVERHPLRRLQRANLMLVMTFAQLLQALFFGALLCALLVVLGALAIPVGVVELWVGPGSPSQPLPVEPLVVGGAPLPITVNLVKTSVLLSLIAALPFVLSAVSEPRYRERFFDPILADMRRAVIVRDALLQSARPSRPSGPASAHPPTAARRGRADGRGRPRR